MNSTKIWEGRWNYFFRSAYSSGSSLPDSISEIFHTYENFLINKTLKFNHTMTVLDIGAGSGRWTLTLAPKVSKVVAIEPTNAYYLLKRNTACFKNVECHKKSFGNYKSAEKFDIVIISGVLTYIDEEVEFSTFLSNALNMINPGGYLFLREPVVRKCKCISFKPRQNIKSHTINYFEVSRTKNYYNKICASNNFKLVKSNPNHATVLYHIKFPLLKTWIRKLMLRVYHRRHLTFWFLYNALFCKSEALLRLALNIPKIYIMIYKKCDQELYRSQVSCSKQLLEHIDYSHLK